MTWEQEIILQVWFILLFVSSIFEIFLIQVYFETKYQTYLRDKSNFYLNKILDRYILKLK